LLTVAHVRVVIDAMRFGSCFKEVPCAAGFINDVVVVVEDGDREFVAAQIFPDVFNRIEFRSVGWQTHKGDVFGDRERGSNVIAGAIEDESGVATCRHLAADRSEMQRHGLGVRRRHDQTCCETTLRTSGAEQVGPVVALIVRRAGPRATFGPDAGQIKPVLKLKHHEIAEFTDKHGVNVEWLLEGKGRIFEKDPIRLSPNSTGAQFAAVVATMPMADQQAITAMVREMTQERNQ
jgi:hypothetical protein